jgi:hypothetical protein
MKLLAYPLTLFGFFVITNGAKPSIEWIGKKTDKFFSRRVGFINVILTICFCVFGVVNYLIEY